MATGEQATVSARSSQVAEVEHMAEARANADASNMRELQRGLRRVEVQSVAAQARSAEQAQQEVALVQNVFAGAEGRRGEVQNRAQILKQRLEVAAGLLADDEELRGRAKAKGAQRADMRRQLGEQRAAFEQQLARMKVQMREQLGLLTQAIDHVER
eukprot:9129373-Alexandrium_andersonii.AAC.1